MTEMPHVVVVGAASWIRPTASGQRGFPGTLLERTVPHVQQLLYQVATGGLNPVEVTYRS